MRKFILFFLTACTLISCSDDNNIVADDTPKLQKVIFNPNPSGAYRIWNFNNDGLLSEITKGDETLLQNFTYDSNGRVISSTVYNLNNTTTTYNFTYNSDGSVATYNNIPLNFDNALDVYYFGDLNSSYRLFKLNSEGLLTYIKSGGVEIDETGTTPYVTNESYVNYTAENLTGQTFNNENFNGFGHDDNINPMRRATIAAFKAFSVTDYNMEWLNSFAISKNNVIRKNYPSEYYIHAEYEYVFNSNNMPVSATLNFYEMDNLDFSNTAILYYYQGDVLP